MELLKPAKACLTAAMVPGASFIAVAQTNTTPATGTTQAAGAVGVTPQTAAEANRQAVPRSDTGTVVRTSPNVSDSVRSATSRTGNTGNAESISAVGTTGITSGSTNTCTTSMRAARADRN